VTTPSTRIVLIRHGQALCNVDRTIEGVETCRGLSELGHRQAALVAERLRAEKFAPDVIVSSPIRRARETAEAIASALVRPIHAFDPGVEEVRPGEAEGMSWDQYFSFYGTSEGWEPEVPFAPGAEAWVHFASRVSTTIDRLAASHLGQTCLVVAHGGVVDASVFHFFGLDPHVRSPIDFEVSNTSITEWELRSFAVLTPAGSTEDAPVPPVQRWRMVRYNDAAHLSAL
jgi:2,3-bisphosphoglycerate-dependent phosphoglycerate mutase